MHLVDDGYFDMPPVVAGSVLAVRSVRMYPRIIGQHQFNDLKGLLFYQMPLQVAQITAGFSFRRTVA